MLDKIDGYPNLKQEMAEISKSYIEVPPAFHTKTTNVRDESTDLKGVIWIEYDPSRRIMKISCKWKFREKFEKFLGTKHFS